MFFRTAYIQYAKANVRFAYVQRILVNQYFALLTTAIKKPLLPAEAV